MKRRVALPSIVSARLISAWDNATNGEGKSWLRTTSTVGVLKVGW